ncbi:unnamed protein product [Strongylus vulgaris]|uniref:Ionotropic glutamate receptor C-terminal domain-containing protein n=1 Tax=Strongylus vulgaris TaxID=40348 RepID=A0A3P7IXV0_STRVU|nr:unnamed protein product [Strongylus vulgaris]
MYLGSLYREEISRAILRLQEKTVLTELKEKWWKDKSVVCPAVVKRGTDDGGSIGGIFIILVIGLGVTVILVVCEMASRRDVVAQVTFLLLTKRRFKSTTVHHVTPCLCLELFIFVSLLNFIIGALNHLP